MLIQSSLPSSIEAAMFHVSDHRQQNSLCDWLPATETWQMCPKCDGKPGTCKQNADISSSLNFDISSQHSTVSTMSGSTAPTFVYQRRKLQGNYVPIFSAQDPADTRSDDCLSVVSSDALSMTIKDQQVVSQAEDETEAVGTPTVPPTVSQSEPHLLRSDLVQEELISYEPPKSSKHKMLEVDSINDSCSSSKSNMELVSAFMKTEVDENAECSSSSAVVLEFMDKDLSEKDLCISILKNEGLLERFQPTQIRVSGTDMDSNGGPTSSSSSRLCKVCGCLETALRLLICDNCEEAFHISCYNPRIKKIPNDEWFCYSCLKQKNKILKKTARKSPNIISERGRGRNILRKGEPSAIELMLRATEPYTTSVRIGKGFQADVPDWSAPVNNDADSFGEPLGLDPLEHPSLHELNSNKSSKLSSIGNWLQCRRVLEGIGDGLDGSICGKWRRAPLFEVQTDDWECFCAVEWNPTHADCAVPQELETDQVLKQLKYIEMLRPQLPAKRRKSNCAKSVALQQSENLLNSGTQTT